MIMSESESKIIGLAKGVLGLGMASAIISAIKIFIVLLFKDMGYLLVFLVFGPVMSIIRFILLFIMGVMLVRIIVNIIKNKLFLKKAILFSMLGIFLWGTPYVILSVNYVIRSMTPFVPTAGAHYLSNDCLHQKHNDNFYVSDMYLAQDVLCATYEYKLKNGRMPTAYDDIKPFFRNKYILHTDFEVVFDGSQPRKYGIISIVENKGSDGDEPGTISAWLKNPHDSDGNVERGLLCVYGDY